MVACSVNIFESGCSTTPTLPITPLYLEGLDVLNVIESHFIEKAAGPRAIVGYTKTTNVTTKRALNYGKELANKLRPRPNKSRVFLRASRVVSLATIGVPFFYTNHFAIAKP